jgi:hypothetical protein
MTPFIQREQQQDIGSISPIVGHLNEQIDPIYGIAPKNLEFD